MGQTHPIASKLSARLCFCSKEGKVFSGVVLSFCFIAVTVLDAKNSGRNFVGVFSERGRAKGNESCEFLLTVLLTGVVSIVWGEQKQVCCCMLQIGALFFFSSMREHFGICCRLISEPLLKYAMDVSGRLLLNGKMRG